MCNEISTPPLSDNDSPSRRFLDLAKRANTENRAAIFDALAEARIETLVVSFDGYGDSGQIESIDAFDATDQAIDLPGARQIRMLVPQKSDPRLQTEQKSLRDAIEMLVYEYLEATHMGWEDGEGAYGTFVFALPERTVTLEHNQRFVDADTSVHTF